jgi:hypothetical protein
MPCAKGFVGSVAQQSEWGIVDKEWVSVGGFRGLSLCLELGFEFRFKFGSGFGFELQKVL